MLQHAAGPVHAGMSAEERAKYVHAERKPEEAEGGRLHPHTDRAGTDAVVLLNMDPIYEALCDARAPRPTKWPENP